MISKRQVVRLLTDPRAGFLSEATDVRRAGLETARWITVDDTGARHKGANGVCTQIGNDHFTWFATTGSKSRLNFLELLRAGHGDYVINDAAVAYCAGTIWRDPTSPSWRTTRPGALAARWPGAPISLASGSARPGRTRRR